MGFYDESHATADINALGLTSIGSINAAATVIYDGTIFNFTLPWRPGTNSGLLVYDFAWLNTLSFPMLNSIGGDFLFAQNPSVQSINGFPNLSRIGGNLNITGNFDAIDFPRLNSVGGTIYIQSTSSKFQCPNNLKTLGNVPGHCGTISTSSPNSSVANTNSTLPPERYELCKTDDDILVLQQT